MTDQAAAYLPTCDESDCIGIQLLRGGKCLAHATARRRKVALGQLHQTGLIDARGVPITEALLKQILAAAPRDTANHPTFALARFDQATFHGVVGFREATFAVAGFQKATFQDNAWFDGATFQGSASFEEATFHGLAGFYGATFHDDADFARATFHDHGWFDGATFQYAAFSRSTFRDTAGFHKATFHGDAWFGGVTFQGYAWFEGATFHGAAELDGAILRRDARFVEQGLSRHASLGRSWSMACCGWTARISRN